MTELTIGQYYDAENVQCLNDAFWWVPYNMVTASAAYNQHLFNAGKLRIKPPKAELVSWMVNNTKTRAFRKDVFPVDYDWSCFTEYKWPMEDV